MNFDELPEFKKDVKKLSKRWHSIPEDIEAVKKYILPLYQQLAPDVDIFDYRREFFSGKNAAVIHNDERCEVVKMRLDVAYLGRNDKVRVIFVAIVKENTVTFVELYAKNDKSKEDINRYKKYIK